ncbi:MAG: OST-HTH/LOTUS domain-containing protein [Prevotellaceae bacterium]|nr:OST-HTH/LOTUS domain-containing protein [Prevotellaceae bacterium]
METEKSTKPVSFSFSAKLKLYNEKPKVKVKLEPGDTPDSVFLKEAHIFDEAFDFYEKESVTLSQLGFILKKIHPRYKPRRYGCNSLRAIYEKLDKYEVVEAKEPVVYRKQEKING